MTFQVKFLNRSRCTLRFPCMHAACNTLLIKNSKRSFCKVTISSLIWEVVSYGCKVIPVISFSFTNKTIVIGFVSLHEKGEVGSKSVAKPIVTRTSRKNVINDARISRLDRCVRIKLILAGKNKYIVFLPVYFIRIKVGRHPTATKITWLHR